GHHAHLTSPECVMAPDISDTDTICRVLSLFNALPCQDVPARPRLTLASTIEPARASASSDGSHADSAVGSGAAPPPDRPPMRCRCAGVDSSQSAPRAPASKHCRADIPKLAAAA